MVPENPGEVFISYSHDSEEHIHSVLALSNRLRGEGINCVLDQYEDSPPEGWPRWMDRKIAEAEFVLMICTRPYCERVMGISNPNEGLGVRWEGGLIYNHLYRAGTLNTRFVPVLLRKEDVEHIPTPLQGASRYCVAEAAGYDDLYGRLTGQPKVEKAPLGKRRALKSKDVKTDFALYAAMPIDMDLWNQAQWHATLFLSGGGQPPTLGLAFRNEELGVRIFQGWHQRYGDSDRYEELRVSIIEGDVPGKGAGYSVHIGPDPDNTIRRYRDVGLKFDFKE